MRVLPNMSLLKRSIMIDSRMIMTYFFRFFVVGVLLVILYSTYDFSTQQRFSALGLRFFEFVSYLNIFTMTLAGIVFFASAVTEEREDKTLDLLLMTGITPFSLLVSKFISKLLIGVTLILAQFPFTILAVTLGGISVDQIISAYFCVIAYMFLIAGVSLLASVLTARTTRASALTILLLVLFWGVHVIVFLIVNFTTDVVFKIGECLRFNNSLTKLWLSFSPFMRLEEIFTTRSGYAGEMMCFQVWVCLGLGVLAFVLSWLLFNWAIRHHLQKATRLSLKDKILGIKVNRKKVNTSRVWRLALLWKEFYFNAGGIFGMFLRIVFYAGFVAVFIFVNFNRYFTTFSFSGFFLCIYATGLIALPVEVVWLITRIFRREINDKTFSTIVLLPYSIAQLVYQKFLVLLPSLVPCCVFLVVGFLGVYHLRYTSLMDFWFFFFCLMTLIFFVHLNVYLSLFLRYGAFAVSLIITLTVVFFSGMFFAFILRTSGPESWIYTLDFIFIVATALLHIQVFSRLRAVSAM